ncbi:MAG TPA: 4-(cytidine 5'-diphospho)-2-C-methyl-D-erythritol kinase, partial [Acidimicrobiales bacterium]|nr:4-(cytidine 5'-diphospho)-2-C-methyl-D-erythritol kinase [Acidimicrobiales bacterium]
MIAQVLAPAKVTLTLRVTGVRADGYHLIDAEMVTVDLADELVIDVGGEGIEVVDEAGRGLAVPADASNLVVRALRLAARTAHVRLTKRIPAGGGLGGGSADAAAVLRWAGFDDPVAAGGLGADVAFCLRGGRARVTGVGEVVEPLPHLDRTLTLLTPPFGCPTPAV